MNEAPWRITFDTNPDTCNLRCIMCEEHSIFRTKTRKEKRLMDPDIITKVITDVADKGLKEVIPSTMGEPLLYPHFERFLTLSDEHGFKINLTTNGTFPGGVDGWARRLLPRSSDIKISINGSCESINENVMRGIDHNRMVEGIERFLELKRENYGDEPTITFQVTYMESNLHDLVQLLDMAIDMGVNRFKGHHLWITWPEMEKESLTRDRTSRERWNETVDLLRKRAKGKIHLDNVEKVPLEEDAPVLPNEYVCPFANDEAWIAWDGTFNVCCAPDEMRKNFGDFGNVNEGSLFELWNSDRYRKFSEMAGKHYICKKCNMRRPPGGGQ